MDWYPLFNSLRIATISCTIVFFLGIFAAHYVARLPRWIKGVLDVILTLPMVLPPTVVGYFLLLIFGAKRAALALQYIRGGKISEPRLGRELERPEVDLVNISVQLLIADRISAHIHIFCHGEG